jgi:hypothetical protein
MWIGIAGMILVGSCAGCVATVDTMPHPIGAIALGPVVLTTDEGRRDPKLMCHERFHVSQWRADPWRFWLRYGL